MFALNIKSKIFLIVSAIIITGAIFYSGFFLGQIHQTDKRGKITRLGLNKYTNPILFCDISYEDEKFTELKPIKTAISKLANSQIKNGMASNISVYVRTLNSGRWIGINENEKFIPASLFKISVMMAYFKEAEINPKLLESKIKYDGRFDKWVEKFGDEPTLKNGKWYTIDSLIEKMILRSDNAPLFILAENINQDIYNNLFTTLGISVPNNPEEIDKINFLSTKDYALFFRALYNASYLSREMSEKAIALLSGADFPSGIVAGVPKDLTVAHKFGSRVLENNSTASKQLHDCGIIYYKDHPYFLCVMTKGNDFDKLQKVIALISEETYKEISLFFTSRTASNN